MNHYWTRFKGLDGLTEEQNRVYRNFNIFVGIGLLDIVVVAITVSRLPIQWPLLVVLGEFLLFIFVLIVHMRGNLLFARYAAFILLLILQIIASLTHGREAGFELIFFIISVLPFLFFETRRHYISLFVISLLTHLWIEYRLQNQQALIKLDTDFPLYWNTFITASIIFGVLYAFKLGYQKTQASLQLKNKEITLQKEEIESINNNLEQLVMQRTQKIREHERLLREYANINAHKVRSPLARIMGLLHVIELENEKEKVLKDLLPALKDNTKELSHMLDEVSRSLNNVNQIEDSKIS